MLQLGKYVCLCVYNRTFAILFIVLLRAMRELDRSWNVVPKMVRQYINVGKNKALCLYWILIKFRDYNIRIYVNEIIAEVE